MVSILFKNSLAKYFKTGKIDTIERTPGSIDIHGVMALAEQMNSSLDDETDRNFYKILGMEVYE